MMSLTEKLLMMGTFEGNNATSNSKEIEEACGN
jgi:hypothetical protein